MKHPTKRRRKVTRIRNEPPTSMKPGIHRLEMPVEVKLSSNEDGKPVEVAISGYTGNSVDLTDYGVDAPVVYVTNGIKYKNKMPYLYGHYDPIGHVTNVKIANHQLSATGVHSDPGERSKRVAGGIANGMPYQASMGLDINPESVVYHAEGSVVVNGKTFDAPIYVVNESELVELSAVLFGRDGDTEITPLSKETLMLIKNAKGNRVNNGEGGTTNPPPENPAPPAPTPTPTPDPKPEPTPAPTPTQVANSDGCKIGMVEYVELTQKYPSYGTIILNGMKEGKDRGGIEDAIKFHQLENSHPRMPSGHMPQTGKDGDKHFLGRLALSCNVQPDFVKVKLGEPIADAAFEAGPMGLCEMLMYVANANGGDYNGHSDVENMCKFIKGRVKNMEWSTIDFPTLMNRVSEWRLEEAWKLDPAWTPGKIHESSQKNHSKTGRLRPAGGEMWKKLDKDGKIQHGSFGEESYYETTLETAAQLLTFKREDILKDDIGLINDMLDLMVEGATMIPDFQLVNVIYNAVGLTDGVNKFTLPFTRDNLKTVYDAVRRRYIAKGDKTVNNAINTRWRLVHTFSLEEDVWEVIKQDRLVSGANTPQGDKNFWFNRLDLDMFPNLDNVTYHPDAKQNAWGLIPVRTQMSPYTITYLNGRKKPTTETVELPADMLGFGVRGYWDVKVQPREMEHVAWSFPDDPSSSV